MIPINKGTNNEEVLNINRALVVQYLKIHGVCSRAEISKSLGLTGASISKIVSTLIDAGIVNEVGFIDGEKGRRSVGVKLNDSAYKVIGVKLSRRSFSVGVFDIGGVQYDTCSEKIQLSTQLKDVIDRIKNAIFMYLNRYQDIVSIGVAVPGPFSREQGEILLMTEMSDWVNIPIRDFFEGVFQVPVYFEHDANAGALAEWWFSSQYNKGHGTLVHFLVGEGVGAGIVCNGNILYGHQGIAGEIGHISIDVNGERCSCGNYGCLEKYCSSIAFVKYASQQIMNNSNTVLKRIYPLTAEAIFEAAQNGDEFAIELVKRVSRYIGYGVINLINAYDPDIIVISNIMSLGGNILLEEVKRVVQERLNKRLYENVIITLSKFSTDPILYGAAAIAIDKFLRKPPMVSNTH